MSRVGSAGFRSPVNCLAPASADQCPRAGAAARAGFAPFLRLQSVAERIVVTPPEPALLALAFPRLDQVLETPRPLHGGFAALRAPLVPQHPQLILPLPRDSQMREFVFNPLSHFGSSTSPLCNCVPVRRWQPFSVPLLQPFPSSSQLSSPIRKSAPRTGTAAPTNA